MPTPRTTGGTTIGRMKPVRQRPASGTRSPRRPSAAIVPSTVAISVAPDPMTRLLRIDRRQASFSISSSNQRPENP